MVRKPTYEELEQRVKESFSGKKEFAISLIDNAPIFFVALDAQGKTLMMNQLMMKVLGYTANEVVGKDYLSNFVPKKDRDMLASVFRKLTADHEHTFNENHILSKDGKEFLVEWHGTPVFDTSSKLQYFYGIGIDITNRKQIEQALRESEKRFRTLVETMNEGLGVADENSVVTYINDRLSKMIGYSPDEIIGRPIYDFIDETYHELVKEIISERKSGESGSYELVLKRKDNQKVYTILSPSPIFDVKGQYWGSCGVMTDITERKQAEEALKESELNHKTLIHNIPGMVYRGYTDWSAEIISGSEEICGYTKKEINSEKEGWLNIIHSEDKAGVLREGSELVKGKHSTVQTYRIVTKGGGNRWVEDRKTSLFSEEGEFIGIDGIVFDITKRKQAEEALWRSEERLTAFLDSATDGFILFDSELNYVKMNQAAQEITGVDRKEVIGKNVLDVIPDFKETGRYNEYKKVMKTGVPLITPDLRPHPKFGNKRLNLKAFKVGDGLGVIFTDITERKQMEEKLKEAHDELEQRVEERTKDLEIKTERLEEVNAAMKVLLEHSEMYKQELEEKVLSNIKELVDPYLEKLEGGTSDIRKIYLSIIRSNIDEIISPFTRKLSSKYLNLTPSEIRIANLVKQGKTSKEIAGLLNVSGKTVGFHRESIRKKLGLKNKKANLRSHLLSLQ